MSATPRTEEQVLAYRAEDGSEMVHASFAAALEIELDGLRAEVGRLLERIDGERGYSIEVENELKVLREKVSELEDNLDVARHRLDEAEGDAEQMEKDLNFKISELEDLLAEAEDRE
jgi:septal ring factor EnvC (AmiA/AmiB activator)